MNIPIKSVDDKRQITDTFAVSCTEQFLPIQLIYAGKSKRSLPKYSFPPSFSVKFKENHWSNTEKSVEFFKEITFLYLEDTKRLKSYSLEQHALVIMDTFKGEDNDTLKKLCAENYCDVVIVPHNLTSSNHWICQQIRWLNYLFKISIMIGLLIRYSRNFKMEEILPMLKYHPNYRIWNLCMRDGLLIGIIML